MLTPEESHEANGLLEKPSDINDRPRRRSLTSRLHLEDFHSSFKHSFAGLPSIPWREALRPKVWIGWDDKVPPRSTDTSWLDGLRGVASVQVFFFHFFGRHAVWGHPWGSTPDSYNVHQLTILRPIWAGGSGAVSVFFVISGYALTYKSLVLMRRKQWDELYNGLCSSLFRRGFRLYLPIVILAIPTLFLIRWVDMTGGFVYDTEIEDTLGLQFLHFLNKTDEHINPFAYKDNREGMNRYAYVPTSWTIPMEYYGSIVTYLMVMLIARLPSFRLRAGITAFMTFYSLHQGSWFTSNFIFGLLIADWNLEQSTQEQAKQQQDDLETIPSPKSYWRYLQYIRSFFFVLCFVAGYYISGMPPHSIPFDFAPVPHVGYEFLYKMFPPVWLFRIIEDSRWWWYWCGNFMFLGVSQVPTLKRVFETKFCHWLGKISFALYLVHALVIALLGPSVEAVTKSIGSNLFWLCASEFVLLTPVIIVLSVFVERWIDRPSVKFAKWLEIYCLNMGKETFM